MEFLKLWGQFKFLKDVGGQNINKGSWAPCGGSGSKAPILF